MPKVFFFLSQIAWYFVVYKTFLPNYHDHKNGNLFIPEREMHLFDTLVLARFTFILDSKKKSSSMTSQLCFIRTCLFKMRYFFRAHLNQITSHFFLCNYIFHCEWMKYQVVYAMRFCAQNYGKFVSIYLYDEIIEFGLFSLSASQKLLYRIFGGT